MNIVKGVADLLRKSTPSSPAAASAGGAGGGGAGGGGSGDASNSADKLAAAPSPRVRFRYPASCSFAVGWESATLLVRTVGECAQVAFFNSSSCL
jgi:hypothetical protein